MPLASRFSGTRVPKFARRGGRGPARTHPGEPLENKVFSIYFIKQPVLVVWVWGSGSGFFAGSGLRSLETRGGVGGYHWAGVARRTPSGSGSDVGATATVAVLRRG